MDIIRSDRSEKRDIEQIPLDHFFDYEKLPKPDAGLLFAKGLFAISNGEVAAVVLAGGQASRLGADVPKGAYKLGLGIQKTDSLFCLQASRLCRLLELAKRTFPATTPSIPWLIMTSDSTDAATRKHIDIVLEETGFPKEDVIIFKQNEVPTTDFDGNVLMRDRDVIATNPDGNGGIYEAISPFLEGLEKRGVNYFHVFSVDNILNRIADPNFIGACIERDADCAAKVIEKTEPDQALGNLCMEKGLVYMLEYSEISPEVAQRRDPNGKLFLRMGSIANHIFRLDFMKRVCGDKKNGAEPVKLAYHAAKKKVAYFDVKTGEVVKPTAPNAYKLERFIFDTFCHSKNFLVFQVVAAEEFSPLKNSNDVGRECLKTCTRDLVALHTKWFKDAGRWTDLGELGNNDIKILISPLVSYMGEGLVANNFHLTNSVEESGQKVVYIRKSK